MDKDQPLKPVHQRVNIDIAELLKRYENIMACANMERTSHAAIAAETTQIDVEVNAIIRAAEDILSLTRSMKEAWLFGNLDTLGESPQDIERNQKLDEDAKAVQKAVEAGVLQKLCPEDEKPEDDK
ncbi:hypothetical protein F1880_008708 [Penicillium rolfsii]|nr:hypothetical protein F1880_008708 [Penicillium rolfsii]